jgi:amino acid adenylation domain-containing protein
MNRNFNRGNELGTDIISESLSAQQRRLWVLEQLHHEAGAHHISICTRVRGSLDEERLKQAIRLVQERHYALRSCFQMVNDEPRAVPCARACESLATVDLSSVAERDREQSALTMIAGELSKTFDLKTGPLLRPVLYRLASNEHLLLLILHKIICDRVSALLLAKEIAAAYGSIGATGTPFLQPVSQDAEYVRQQVQYLSSVAHADDLAYWKRTIENASAGIELPKDSGRANASSRHEQQQLLIAGGVLEALKAFAKTEQTSPFVTLLTAFFCLLGRYTGAEDITIGTEVTGRNDPALENAVGALSNQLALRTAYSTDATFQEMMRRVSKVWSDAAQHQTLPFGTLLDALDVPRDINRHPVYQVSFSQGVAGEPFDAAGLLWEPVRVATGTGMLDLSVEIVETGSELRAWFSYSSDLFEHTTIERMMGHLLTLVQSAVEKPAQAVSTLPMLTPEERHLLVIEWNQAPVEYKPEKCIHQLVEAQVARTPNAVAVVCEGQSLTYGELNRRSNQLAHYLRTRGIGRETLVAMCMERSLDMIVGILGILKAGGAYLPLDLSYPPERLAFMIEDANPPVVITQKDLEARVPQHKAEIICVDRDWPAIARESGDNPPSGAGPQNLAYVIYTSGSTGKPKGCQITHFNVVRLFQATWDWYRFDESDVWTMFHSYAFDFSVWEIWGALFYGGRVVIVPYLVSRSPEAFYRLLYDERVTVLNQTPSAFRQLILAEESVGVQDLALRYVIFGGEALEMQSLKPWYKRHGDQKPVLVNMYGITETTVHVTYRPLSATDTDRGSVIGRPIPDLQLYVLDQHRQPVPIGVAGEMYVGGSGVARGYLSRPELTAERFIADPFHSTPDARLYKTGDLARFLSAGDMEYLGRIDHQVKIRGFRIELGEVESVLASHPAIHHSLVMAREDTPGDKRLVAYLVPKANQQPRIADLRAYIRQSLPEYMVPSTFSFLAAFPLTPTGKIDRRALPAPAQEHRDQSAILAPRNEREELLLSIFREILKVETASITDDFFDLGGHSLSAARLVSQIQATTGREVQLADLFRAATVESLARVIQQESDAPQDPVVMEIKRGSSTRLPFFAIVPPGEEALGYAILARHMGPEQTVYKIQGHTPVTRGKRPYSEEEMVAMADEYVAAMRTVQPRGPYCVGGMCDGVHIAEQVVLKLESEGDQVGLFANFDTWVLQNSQKRWLWTLDYYGRRLREIGKLSFSERLASYKRVAQNKVRHMVGAKTEQTDWPQVYWPEDFTPPRFQAPVILFKRPKQPFYYVDDPHMGWNQRTDGGVEVHEVEFSHLEILREPHIRIFGKELSERMARVVPIAISPGTSEESRKG